MISSIIEAYNICEFYGDRAFTLESSNSCRNVINEQITLLVMRLNLNEMKVFCFGEYRTVLTRLNLRKTFDECQNENFNENLGGLQRSSLSSVRHWHADKRHTSKRHLLIECRFLWWKNNINKCLLISFFEKCGVLLTRHRSVHHFAWNVACKK